MVPSDSRLGHFYRAFYGWASACSRAQKGQGYGLHGSLGLSRSRNTGLKHHTGKRCVSTAVTNRTSHFASQPAIAGRASNTLQRSVQRERLRYHSQVAKGTSEDFTEDVQIPPKDQAALGQNLRVALRRLTQPVVVITAANQDENPNSFDPFRGVTVSSFNSITLVPTPYICFNLKLPSRTWDAIETLNTIHIHVLAASAGGMSIAHAFTQPHKHPSQPFYDLQQAGITVKTLLPNGPPVLGDAEQVLARITARVARDKCVNIGDHLLVIAEVIDVTDSASGQEPEKFALSYGLGQYRGGGGSLGLSETPANNLPKGRSRLPSNTPLSQRRQFSTTSRVTEDESSGRKNLSLEELVTDETLLQQTVGDFMGIFNDPHSSPRSPGAMKQLLDLKDQAEAALQQLDLLAQDGKGDSEESLELTRIQLKHSRYVLKTLAQRSAADLREMLDAGKIDYRLTEYMEATIEKGQALLLEETERLRTALDRGMIDATKFREVGRQIQADYAALREVTDRLKMITEEDDGDSFGN